MEWKDSMKTGMQDIDDLYERVLKNVDLILRDMNRSRNATDMQDNINRIKSEFIEIFSYQESLMIMKKYPQYYQHKHHHEQFIDSMDSFLTKADNDFFGCNSASIERMINDWLMKHIFMYDKLLAKFVQGKNKK